MYDNLKEQDYKSFRNYEEMVTDTIPICYSYCINSLFHILQKMGPFDPLALYDEKDIEDFPIIECIIIIWPLNIFQIL